MNRFLPRCSRGQVAVADKGIETLAGTRKPDGKDLAGHLPIMFRDIFRNAFLEFRDGRILTMFQTELYELPLTHVSPGPGAEYTAAPTIRLACEARTA
jgi:hypothetical protein